MKNKIQYDPPIIGIVTGVPGTGKTSISRGLYDGGIKVCDGILDMINAAYLPKDRINDVVTDERSGNLYDLVRDMTYGVIDSLVAANISAGISVWIDATFSTEVKYGSWPERFYNMAKEHGARLKLVRCIAPEEIIMERLAKRGYSRDIWKLENWNRFMEMEPVRTPLKYGGIEIDTSMPYQRSVENILNFLSS